MAKPEEPWSCPECLARNPDANAAAACFNCGRERVPPWMASTTPAAAEATEAAADAPPAKTKRARTKRAR